MPITDKLCADINEVSTRDDEETTTRKLVELIVTNPILTVNSNFVLLTKYIERHYLNKHQVEYLHCKYVRKEWSWRETDHEKI